MFSGFLHGFTASVPGIQACSNQITVFYIPCYAYNQGMEGNPIVVEQTFDASIDEVWNAIVHVDQMRQWFFETISDFEPEVGFETQFNVHVEGQDYLHLWKVTEVTPGRKITYNWRYRGYPGNSFVTWELSEVADGTKLTLTHEGIESFPQDNPIFSRQAGEEGWSYFLNQSLKAFLERGSS